MRPAASSKMVARSSVPLRPLAPLALLALLSGAAAQDQTYYLVNTSALPYAPMARCLDGSPYIFYVAPGVGDDAKNVMIWLEGGGWCYSLTDCLVRSRGCSPGGACGSSNGRGPTSGAPMGGILSANATLNPTFAGYTKVYAPYCDGDSFAGMATDPVSFNGSSLFFRGAYNLRAVLDFLRTPAGNNSLLVAPKVVLTGCSAGGLAVYLHADEVAAAVGAATDFRAVPVSGFFSNAANAEGAPVYAEQIRGAFLLQNASGGLNQACVAAQDPGFEWVCNMALPSYQYTKSRIFPINSHARTDPPSRAAAPVRAPPHPRPSPSDPDPFNRLTGGRQPACGPPA